MKTAGMLAGKAVLFQSQGHIFFCNLDNFILPGRLPVLHGTHFSSLNSKAY